MAIPTDVVSPFGTHALTGPDRMLAGAVRTIRGGDPVSKVLRLPFRPLVARFRTRSQTPVDAHWRGFRVRLYPSESLHQHGLLFYPSRIDPRVLGIVEQTLVAGDTFLDAGSHAGSYALVAARRVGSQGRVIAVEADSVNCARMRFNLELNALSNVTPVHVGLSDREEVLALNRPSENLGSASFSSSATAAPDIEEVRCRPLLDVLEEAGVDTLTLAKFDIEGFEERVLRAFFESAPEALVPSRLIVEYNATYDLAPLRRLLDEHGYRVVHREGLNAVLEHRNAKLEPPPRV